jgi:hypothetical protein
MGVLIVGAAAPADPARVPELERLNVPGWHQRHARGQGLRVAVLDSGFRGYRQHLGTALPERVTVRSFRADGNLEAKDSQHGILCAEIIHQIAPDAELLLANWEPDQPERFLDALAWCREHGAQVVSCSMIMPSWGDGSGGGPIHQRLSQVLTTPTPMLFCASAGNTALRHWTGGCTSGADGWHEWQVGSTSNPLKPYVTDRVAVDVYWADTGAEFALDVLDTTTQQRAGTAIVGPGGATTRVVRFVPTPGHEYAVRVRQTRGTATTFHVMVLGATLEHATATGSVPFPADNAQVLAIGAVSADGVRATYSSCGGPTTGKPDFVAPVPFASRWRAQPFSGTSAAAPQAAGLVAVYWSAHPNASAAQVRSALTHAARDLGPRGHDTETGHGWLRLPDLTR